MNRTIEFIMIVPTEMHPSRAACEKNYGAHTVRRIEDENGNLLRWMIECGRRSVDLQPYGFGLNPTKS